MLTNKEQTHLVYVYVNGTRKYTKTNQSCPYTTDSKKKINVYVYLETLLQDLKRKKKKKKEKIFVSIHRLHRLYFDP